VTQTSPRKVGGKEDVRHVTWKELENMAERGASKDNGSVQHSQYQNRHFEMILNQTRLLAPSHTFLTLIFMLFYLFVLDLTWETLESYFHSKILDFSLVPHSSYMAISS
jgi:hypothetical protein